ncbi:ADP-ribosylation factor-like protein 6-interacting protein 1 [Culicoides brevitarsis]|uniref:ADP-ribosylation factor-like protein 6-interacting protein 1 n=1 Tax=Culicoides brevitarsis TaxID=469753 RepID=UPI00307B9908
MDNQKKEYNRLKHNMENWRELILLLNSFLKWEQKYYAGVVAGVISFVFLLIWYLDLSFVTCVGLAGLVVTLFDYFYPKISKMLFKSENWRGTQEKQFEEVVQDIFNAKNRVSALYHFVFDAKSEKSTLFILASSTVCVILAWIGSTMNNLLLLYLVSLVSALYPGLLHNGYLKCVTGLIEGRFNCKLGGGGDVKKEN